MAVKQVTDLYLNNQKRFTESAVMTVPAKLSEGDARLGTGPQYIDPADNYQAYCLPKMSLVREFYIYVREAFASGTVATVTTIVDGEAIVSTMAVDVAEQLLLATPSGLPDGALFEEVDGFDVSFNQTSTTGALQVIAKYTAVDEKTGKYVASI